MRLLRLSLPKLVIIGLVAALMGAVSVTTASSASAAAACPRVINGFHIYGALCAKYNALSGGSTKIAYGYPSSEEIKTKNGGYVQRFTKLGDNRLIMWSPATNAHEVKGLIQLKYARTGWENGYNGYPTTDETWTPGNTGTYNHFQGGSVYLQAGAREAFAINGNFRTKWASMGWERSCLGFPVSDVFVNDGGTQQNFQRGVLSSPAGSSYVWSSC